MIVGIGVDVVDVARFTRAIERTPALVPRLFAEVERDRPPASLAARFAAKEALIKALGETDERFRWVDMVIDANEHRNPHIAASGGVAHMLAERGITDVHVSLTHDAGIACAFVVCEARS